MNAKLLHEKEAEKVPQPGEGLGGYCRRLRGERTLKEVASAANLVVSSLHRIEIGETKRLKRETRMGLAIALGIPEEWLEAAAKGEVVQQVARVKICPNCWTPGTRPDEAWGLQRARYCCICAEELTDRCGNCGTAIEKWSDRFCRQCGSPLGRAALMS